MARVRDEEMSVIVREVSGEGSRESEPPSSIPLYFTGAALT